MIEKYLEEIIARHVGFFGQNLALLTSRKKGFHSPQLVPKLFDPQLKGALVPVHSKIWAREH
jgi:hypothetical protein